jgi:hypothetical protein
MYNGKLLEIYQKREGAEAQRSPNYSINMTALEEQH